MVPLSNGERAPRRAAGPAHVPAAVHDPAVGDADHQHDGGLRARVERVAVEEDAVVVTADLNEFNYSVQRFASAT